MDAIQIFSLAGIVLSLYTYYVEQRLKQNGSYHAACDISSYISCTRAFKTGYGHLFGVSNAIPGVALYTAIFLLQEHGMADYVLYLSALAMLVTIYLAYVQYFRVRSFCLVCNAIYIINIALLALSWMQYTE